MTRIREFGKKNAIAMLSDAGLTADHPHYNFFLTLLTAVCEAATKQTRAFRSAGNRLNRILAAPQSKHRAELDRLAADLLAVDRAPDFNAVRLAMAAARTAATEFERQSANRERKAAVRNSQIASRCRALTKSGMSQRAAARKVRSELALQISEARIRQIAFPAIESG